jgi:predicted nucleotidyltransferase component of viral defense system
MNQDYIDTVRLLLAVAPAVFQSPRFAMKGGTALNLFVQDMPRLSVDIDVAFTDHTLDREAALRAIGSARRTGQEVECPAEWKLSRRSAISHRAPPGKPESWHYAGTSKWYHDLSIGNSERRTGGE